jgi:hypothetical protein
LPCRVMLQNVTVLRRVANRAMHKLRHATRAAARRQCRTRRSRAQRGRVSDGQTDTQAALRSGRGAHMVLTMDLSRVRGLNLYFSGSFTCTTGKA